ncbi:MAG: hypothetical protein ACOYOE_11080 [Chlorobium sp.]
MSKDEWISHDRKTAARREYPYDEYFKTCKQCRKQGAIPHGRKLHHVLHPLSGIYRARPASPYHLQERKPLSIFPVTKRWALQHYPPPQHAARESLYMVLSGERSQPLKADFQQFEEAYGESERKTEKEIFFAFFDYFVRYKGSNYLKI